MRGRRARGAGFTLLELMVVMAILGVLLGMSAAVFSKASRSYRFVSVVNQAATILRAARNDALASESLATVRLEEREDGFFLSAVTQRTLASWHLEEPGETCLGKTLSGGQAWPKGKIGGCLAVAPGNVISAGPSTGLPAREGLAMSAWFNGEEAGASDQVLFDYGGQLTVSWLDDGSLEAQVAGISARTGPLLMLPYRWVQVEVVYDRSQLTLVVNGIVQASVACDSPLNLSAAPVTISSKSRPFAGLVDEWRIAVFNRPEEIRVPEDVKFVAGPRTIRFTSQGRLDPNVHPQGAALVFYDPNKERWREVAVSAIGRVRSTQLTSGPLPDKPSKPKPSQPKGAN